MESDVLIDEVIRPAFGEYLSLYIDLIHDSSRVTEARSKRLLSGQKNYLNYRSTKDPARGMLSRFYGKNWAEEYISNVLFNI